MTCDSCGAPSPARLRTADDRLVCGPCFDFPAGRDEPAPPPALWPNQVRGLDGIAAARAAGHRCIALYAPCGAGKSLLMAEACRREALADGRGVIVTPRKILTEQNGGALDSLGLDPGYVAAGFGVDASAAAQVFSLHTFRSRVIERRRLVAPRADFYCFDEAHLLRSGFALWFIRQLLARGRTVLLTTATPHGLAKGADGQPLATALVCAGTVSELRRLGKLVPCRVYAPNEPDPKTLKRKKVEDRLKLWFASADVFGWFGRINPDRRPSLLWAPGVEESRWFAAEFNRRGVSAAHIDGTTDPDERRRVFAESKAGRVVVICSCGVLREGVDLPWVAHGILCQIAAKESAYLQIVGRLLRAAPGKTLCTLQDHSAAYRRHGSPNLDREFDLHDTDQSRAANLRDGRRNHHCPKCKAKRPPGRRCPVCGYEPAAEGVVCPKCRLVRKGGPECPGCGHKHVRSSRQVIMGDGALKAATGAVVKKRRQVSKDQAEWTGCLCAAAHRGLTLFAAAGWFARKTGRRLPPDCQPQPELGSIDWSRRAADVYLWLRKRVRK